MMFCLKKHQQRQLPSKYYRKNKVFKKANFVQKILKYMFVGLTSIVCTFIVYNTFWKPAQKVQASRHEWLNLMKKQGLDYFPVLTINLPAKRKPSRWLFHWPQGLHVYEIDIRNNYILPTYIPASYEIDYTSANIKYKNNYLKKIKRDINPQNQKIFPKEWITALRPRKDRLIQIQQTRDFIMVIQHFYDTFCINGYFKFILYVEDDFIPCMDEYENLARVLKWAKLNYERISFIRLTYGLGAVLLQCIDIKPLVFYLQSHVSTPGVDNLVDQFFNNPKEWTKRCQNETSCLERLPFTVYRSSFYHGGTNKSTIWTKRNTAVFENKGCSLLKTTIEYYTGYDKNKECFGENIISPCPNSWYIPFW